MCVFCAFVNFDSYQRRILEEYFYDGFQHTSIIRFLREYHSVDISLRTLYRRLADYGLRRRMQPSPFPQVWNAICVELRGPGISISHVCDFE